MEQQKLNTAVVYVLSIIGLLCCCFGGLGILLSAPAFFIAQSGLKKASISPDDYDPTSVKAMTTAKTVALVITIICAITLIYNIYDLSTGGWEARQEMMNEFMEGYQQGMEDAGE
ncbi:CCC motif membrane protein [Winogradskyella sp. 4-2091]|uniref:CCC motif membrane protein n=1 Tax=Winogradskyella sp. 4-2091 TaxID=3381659 RepID=UPI003891AC92